MLFSGLSILYYLLGILVVLYLAILFIVNRISNVTIKALGWLAVKHVTIKTKKGEIFVRKAKFTVNPFRSRDSPLKLFNLEFHDMEINVVQSTPDVQEKIKTNRNEENIETDILKALKLCVPRNVFEIIFRRRIFNKFNLHFFRFAIYNKEFDDSRYAFFDYARLESNFNTEGRGLLIATVINGYTHTTSESNESEDTKFIRNVEFCISFNTVFSCMINSQSKLFLELKNFDISLSLGRLSLPLDCLLPLATPNKEDNLQKQSKVDILKLSEDILQVFSSLDIKFEDFSVVYQDVRVQIANLQTVASNSHDVHLKKDALMNLLVYMTSCKLFHKEGQSLSIPSSTYEVKSDSLRLLKTILEFKNGVNDFSQSNNSLEIKSALTITRPVVDIYYDQLELFTSTKKTHTKDPKKNKFDRLPFLNIVHYVSNKILIVDTTVNFHLPNLGSKEFHRGSNLNIIVSCSLLSLYHKFQSHNFKKYIQKDVEKFVINGHFKLKSLKIDIVDNLIHLSRSNLLLSYNFLENNLSIRLTNKEVKLKSVNDVIFRLLRKLRDANIRQHNKLFTSEEYERRKLLPLNKSENIYQEKYIELFKLLPPYISSLKFSSSSIEADIICKDGLPKHVVFDEMLEKHIDLGEFKRGIRIKVNDIQLTYKYSRKEFSSAVRSVQCFTVSEFASEVEDDSEFQDGNSTVTDTSDVSSIDSENFKDEEEDDLKRVKRVLNISDISLKNNCDEKDIHGDRDMNNLVLSVSAVDGKIDIFLIWCSVYALSLVNYFAPEVKRNYTKEEMEKCRGPPRKLKLDIFFDSIAVTIRLPNNVDVLLEFDTMKARNISLAKALRFNFIRLYVVHPSTRLWARLLIIKESIFKYNSAALDVHDKFESIAESIRLNIPHQFLFYTVIDNIITFAKSVRQIRHNFGNLTSGINQFDRIMPQAKRSTNIPKVNVKAKIFGITLENDLFENELSYIFELGKIEQRERFKKLKLFDVKVEEIISNTKPGMEQKIELSNKTPIPQKFAASTMGHISTAPKANSPLRKIFSDSGFCLQSRTHSFRDKFHKHKKTESWDIKEDNETWIYANDKEASMKINQAKERLDKQFATSWIQKYKKFRSNKIHNCEKKAKAGWGYERVHPRITDKFDILNYSSGPQMLCGYFKDMDLTVDKAKLDDVDDFIYKYGKKQPKLDYSILIPLFVSLKSSSLYVVLRDYPLPLLSFPSNNDPNNPAINLYGNFVINEKLVNTKEEMRFIYVPFSPAATASKNECDNFYSVYVPRTLTPVKVILDMKCDLNTNRACMITWCKAYSAGLLAALAAFDKFTKPKIDYSPIGWWDKVALLVHGKAVFNVANELCLHMKASTSPYDLVGKAAGFVFSWRNKVCLRLNDNGISKDLLKLDSDDFVLGIPNYSQAEIDSWSLFYENNNKFLGSGSVPNRFSKKVIKLSSSDRVKWVLGALFERNKQCTSILSDQQPRTSVFKPHYDVRVTSTGEDSYIGYRSDYIHISLAVVSKSSGKCYNAAYFTPLTFHYFFHWWDSLTKHTSLPIRNGHLFSNEPADVSHVKMGSHIFTVKYQLIFEPITISHLYIHSSNGESDRNKLAFTGLKGKFSTCAIDLHQRKEQIRYVNEKLDINNKILHLKMNEGGVDIDDADIRFVNAIFDEKSVRGYLEKYMKDSNDTDSTESRPHDSLNNKFGTFSDWIENVDIFDNENAWIDADDYVEIHQTVRPSQSPSIRILPFFYSPKITYFREFSLHEDGPYPFGNEKFHECIIGLSKPENTQTNLLNERKKNVEKEIETNEQLLPDLSQDEADIQSEEIQKIRKDIMTCKEKLNVIESLEEELQDLTSAPNILKSDFEKDLSTKSNKAPYTDRNMYNKIKDMSIVNSSVSDFHNRFILHNPQLKWHNDLRDLFMEYIQKVGDRKTQVYFMGKKAIDLAESFIKSRKEEDNEREKCDEACKTSYAEKVFRKEYKSSEELLKNFNQQLNEIYSDEHEVEDKYLIKFIHPQIQLVSGRDLKSCILVTSTDVELRIVSINVKGMDDVVSENNEVSKLVESRYGVSFVDSHVFAFKRPENFVTLNDMPYGSNCNSNLSWPPWLATEVCYDSSWAKEQLVIERTSMTFLLMKPNFLVASNCKASIQNTEISLHASKLVITADSDQYSTMYYIITDLLLHTNTQRDYLLNKVDKIVSLSDYNDFNGLDIRIKELQDSIKIYIEIILRLNRNAVLLDGQQREQLTAMEVELERMNIELFVLMNGLGVKGSKSQLSNKNTARLLSVEADQVIWHLLNEGRLPFMDFALAKGRFVRVDSIDGGNINLLDVSMIQGFNLQADAIYPELLKPHLGSNEYENSISISKMDKPIIRVTWRMLNHIGGIPIVQEANVEVQPLKVQLDYLSTKKLYSYLFPDGNEVKEENDDILEDEIKDFEATRKLKVNPFKKFINRERNNLSESVISRDFDAADSSEEVSSSILSSDDLFRTNSQDTSRSSFTIEKGSNNKDSKVADDIAIIMNRSSKYVSIIKIEIAKVNMSISFSAPKHLSILNVHDLAMTIPTLKYKHKMWSSEELILRLRKDIIKIILNHTGKIIGNKFKPVIKKHRTEPLQQISNYASYITLQDLQLKEDDHQEDLILDISSQRLTKTDSIGQSKV